MASIYDTDYSAQIQKLKKSGGSKSEIANLEKKRSEKIKGMTSQQKTQIGFSPVVGGKAPSPKSVTQTTEKSIVKPTETTKASTTTAPTAPMTFGGMGKTAKVDSATGFDAVGGIAKEFVKERFIPNTGIISSGDSTIDKHKMQYEEARIAGDQAGMAAAAQAADEYRLSIGQPAQNTAHVQALLDQSKEKPKNDLLTMEKFNEMWAQKTAAWEEEKALAAEAEQAQNAVLLEQQAEQNQMAIRDLLGQYMSDFSFDATKDPQLAQQSKAVEREIRERFAARGITNASFVESEISRAVNDLAFKIEDMAYTRWKDKADKLMVTAKFLRDLDEDAFDRSVTAFDQKLKSEAQSLQFRKQEFEEKKKEVELAFDRWEELGYADELVSITLGVPMGAPAGEMLKYDLEFEQFKREKDYEFKIFEAEKMLENMIAKDPENPKYQRAIQELERAKNATRESEIDLRIAEIKGMYLEAEKELGIKEKQLALQQKRESIAATQASRERTRQLIEKGKIDIQASEIGLEKAKLSLKGSEKEEDLKGTVEAIADKIFTSGVSVEELENILTTQQSALTRGDKFQIGGETVSFDELGTEGYSALQAYLDAVIKQKKQTLTGLGETEEK